MLLGKLFDNTLNYIYIEFFFLLYICYIIIIGVMINNNSVYYYSKSLVKFNKLSNFVIFITIFIFQCFHTVWFLATTEHSTG